MAEFALRELIDEKRLQHLQNEFCKVTGVMAVCVDKEGRAITEPYIDKSLIRPDGEDPILGEYRKKAAQALDRVQEGSLEEQVVEELPDGGHVAAVAVSVENQIILYWQVYDLKKLDTISFTRSWICCGIPVQISTETVCPVSARKPRAEGADMRRKR